MTKQESRQYCQPLDSVFDQKIPRHCKQSVFVPDGKRFRNDMKLAL